MGGSAQMISIWYNNNNQYHPHPRQGISGRWLWLSCRQRLCGLRGWFARAPHRAIAIIIFISIVTSIVRFYDKNLFFQLLATVFPIGHKSKSIRLTYLGSGSKIQPQPGNTMCCLKLDNLVFWGPLTLTWIPPKV